MKFLILSLLLTSVSVLAQDPAQFAEHKKKVSSEIEQRITILQTEKSCVDSAADGNAMKSCREASKAAHEKMQAAHKQERMEHLDEKIKKLQDEKSKMQQPK